MWRQGNHIQLLRCAKNSSSHNLSLANIWTSVVFSLTNYGPAEDQVKHKRQLRQLEAQGTRPQAPWSRYDWQSWQPFSRSKVKTAESKVINAMLPRQNRFRRVWIQRSLNTVVHQIKKRR
jgi:hypothetical protein